MNYYAHYTSDYDVVFFRSICLKIFRRIIARNRSGRITRSRFISFFRRALSKKCGRKPITRPPVRPRCSTRQLRRTVSIVKKGITKLYCTNRRRYRYSAVRFLKSFFRRNQYRGYLRTGALSTRLSKQLPRGSRKLRSLLTKLK